MLALAVFAVVLLVIAPACLYLIGTLVKFIADKRVTLTGLRVNEATLHAERRLAERMPRDERKA